MQKSIVICLACIISRAAHNSGSSQLRLLRQWRILRVPLDGVPPASTERQTVAESESSAAFAHQSRVRSL